MESMGSFVNVGPILSTKLLIYLFINKCIDKENDHELLLTVLFLL